MYYYRLMGIGCLLILASSALLWVSPPSPSSQGISGYSYATDKPLSGWEDHRLERVPGETDRDFATRLNEVIAATIYHCDLLSTPRLIDKLVASLLRINPGSYFESNGFLTPSALRCGLCSQSAYVLARALNLGGVKAAPLNINGHVVTLIHLETQDWIADPDMGLGLFQYQDNMWNEVSKYYLQIPGYNTDLTISALKKAFKTNVDDKESRMDWSNQVELQQRYLIKGFEYFSYGMFFLGLLCFLPVFFKFKKNRAK